MKVTESCAKCLYDRQKARCPDAGYLAEVRGIIDGRSDDDTSPLLVYRFDQAYARRFGPSDSYAGVKRRFNDVMLEMEPSLRARIEAAEDPIETALALSRVGNYIDYAAMDTVDESAFRELFGGASLRPDEAEVYARFLGTCARAGTFLLIADNCGEIVLDKLLLEQLKRRFPRMRLQVLVRGGETLNDVTREDAAYTGVDRIAEVYDNGAALAGTIYGMMSEDARRVLDGADAVLSKGQGNYESLSGQGRHVFYAFLCKCELFTGRFNVPLYTGMLVEE